MFKRLFDILVAATLLLLTLPLMLATALAVRLALGPPVLLRQTRPGKGGIPFLFFKFSGVQSSAAMRPSPPSRKFLESRRLRRAGWGRQAVARRAPADAFWPLVARHQF